MQKQKVIKKTKIKKIYNWPRVKHNKCGGDIILIHKSGIRGGIRKCKKCGAEIIYK